MPERFEGGVLGLADFLADLRADLALAQERARESAKATKVEADGSSEILWLGVEEATVTLEVAHERTLGGKVSGKVTGKFWVFLSAEASTEGSHERRRARTQTLTLTLKPRVERTTITESGKQHKEVRAVDVEDNLAPGEQPSPPTARTAAPDDGSGQADKPA